MSVRLDGYQPKVYVPGTSRTKQSFKASADVNNIVERFQKTGFLENVVGKVPVFADVSSLPDLRSAMELAREADRFFMTMPAAVRELFDNDAAEFVDMLADPKFREHFERDAEEAIAKVAAGGDKPREKPEKPAEPAPEA